MARHRRSHPPQPNSGRKKTKTQQFPPGGQEYPTSGPVEPVVCTQKRIRAQGEAVWARRHTTADRWLNQWSTQWSLQWRMPDMTKTNACSTPPGRQEYPTSGPVEAVVRALKRNTAQGEGAWAHRHPVEYQWSNPWSDQWLRQWCARQTKGTLFQHMLEQYSLREASDSVSERAMRPGNRCWGGQCFTRETPTRPSREEQAALCVEDTEELLRDLARKP